MPHALSACDHCGAVDDHPKIHTPAETFHHDCAPVRVLDEVHESARPVVEAIVTAARSGVRGDELRAYIVGLHPDQTHGEG